jgi:hypothetical protein
VTKIDFTAIGFLYSAHYLAYELDQPGYARDLLKNECIENGFSTLQRLKRLARQENITLSKVWKENF